MSTQDVGPTQVGMMNGDAQSTSGYAMFESQARAQRAALEGNDRQAKEYDAQAYDEFRANAFFTDEEWKTLDTRLMEVREDELHLFDQLRDRGLTTTTDLSTIIYEYEKSPVQTDTGASISMGLQDRAQDELPGLTEEFAGIPIPIVHKSYHLNERTLRVNANSGQDINTATQDMAARGVTNELREMFLNGWSGQVDGYSVDGLTTFADRNTYLAQNWSDTVNTTASEIRGDILSMVELLEDDGFDENDGGYVLYLSRNELRTLRRRTVGTEDDTQLWTRLQDEFGDYIEIERTTSLPAGEAVLLQPSPDVIELVVASDLQNVEWESHAGFTTHMKVMASITPILKSTSTGQSGLVHTTGLAG